MANGDSKFEVEEGADGNGGADGNAEMGWLLEDLIRIWWDDEQVWFR